MEYDVVVVGAGAGGSAAAWRLASLGLKVACFERGEWQNPAHYPSTGLDWELQKRAAFSYRPSVRRGPSDYTIDTTESDIDIANFNGVGGATVLFSGHFLRLHPSDFRTFSLDGVGTDWPLDYFTLEPYFRINDKMMRVAGLAGDPAYPPIDGLSPPVPLGDYGHRIAAGFNSLGWHWWPSYAAIATRSTSGSPCLNLGPCNTGCPQGAKSSTDVTYLPAAMKNGLQVFTGAVVNKVVISPTGEAKGINVRLSSGEETMVSARVVVLACNAIGTARLLLASACSRFPNGLANRSGLVGKNLMLHPLGYAEGLFDQPTDVDKGPQGCCIYSHEFYETSPSHNFTRGYTLHVLRGGGWMETASAGLQRRELRWGNTFVEEVMKLHRRRAMIAVICEDLPEQNNCVSLDHSRKDVDGLPVTRVQYRVGQNSRAMLNHGLARAKQVLQAGGLKKVMAFGPVRDAGWHLLGTTRMGRDPDLSVVSVDGECHDVPGLFVADGSLFPTSGGVNPASTLQALALYVADRLYERHFGRLPLQHAPDRIY